MARRIVVKGCSGAGKSTLGAALARHLGVPFVELDALHHGPNWTAASPEQLQAKVLDAIEGLDGWVVDGNYEAKLGTLLLDHADLIVWLDLSLPIKLARLTRRTARRILLQEELWSGNRETLKGAVWGAESLYVWTVRMHYRHRRNWPGAFAGRRFVRLRTPQQVEAWLASFCASSELFGRAV